MFTNCTYACWIIVTVPRNARVLLDPHNSLSQTKESSAPDASLSAVWLIYYFHQNRERREFVNIRFGSSPVRWMPDVIILNDSMFLGWAAHLVVSCNWVVAMELTGNSKEDSPLLRKDEARKRSHREWFRNVTVEPVTFVHSFGWSLSGETFEFRDRCWHV